MRVFAKSFISPKDGNLISEFEDACFPSLDIEDEKDERRFRFSIADGASSGLLSGQWAKVLSEVACDICVPIDDIHAILGAGIEKWVGWRQDYLRKREEQGKPIKWYEEPGLRAGAFATLLAFELNEELSNQWRASAIGDSCMFQVRKGQLISWFPVQQSNSFNSNPALLCSNAANNPDLDITFVQSKGDWQLEDEFYLATDALAQWFLAEFETGQQPWNIFRDLNTSDATQTFEYLIKSLREKKDMRNDDVTLVRITLA